MERDTFNPVSLLTGIGIMAGIGYFISTAAVSSGVRRKILERDGGCIEPGPHFGEIECAHYSHNHNRPDYNTPGAARALCTYHHLLEHQRNFGKNGLSNSANNWAIDKLRQKLDELNWREI